MKPKKIMYFRHYVLWTKIPDNMNKSINMLGNKESSKTIKKPEKEWAQSIARRSYSQ